jgi:hypothetical protein
MSRDETIEKLVETGFWGPVDADLGIDADFKCQYCNKDLLSSVDNYKEWQTDHLIPSSADGADSKENYVICCRTCNFIKGRWNPAAVCSNPHPSREQLISVSRDYILKKRTETKTQIERYREIVSQLKPANRSL